MLLAATGCRWLRCAGGLVWFGEPMRTAILWAILALISACSPEAVSTPPRILYFKAVPELVAAGRTATLEWKTEGADEVTLAGMPVDPSGAFTTQPLAAPATFRLEASNSSDSVARSTEVNVVEGRDLSIEMRSEHGQPIKNCSVTTPFETHSTDSKGRVQTTVVASRSWAMASCEASSWLMGFDGDVEGELVLPAVIDGSGSSAQLVGRTYSPYPIPSGAGHEVVVGASSPLWSIGGWAEPDEPYSIRAYGFSDEYLDFLPWALAVSYDRLSGRPTRWNGIAIGSALDLLTRRVTRE